MSRLSAGRLAWAVALAVLALPVVAQPAPPQLQPPQLRPARDVVVTYAVDGQALDLVPGGLHGPVTLSWDAAGQRLRAEAAGRTQVALIDLRDRAAMALDTALGVALPLPLRERDLQSLTLEGARLAPRGQAVVAGLACTSYVAETGPSAATVCLTADGVPLRGQGLIDGKRGRFTATMVHYGAVPADRFVVPPGYFSLGGAGGAFGGNRGGPGQQPGGALGGKAGSGFSADDMRALLGLAK